MSFVFYDTETTGLDTFFDQVLQFAAIRTDEDLNEIDRINIRCRLLPHVVPSPEALCITGISVEQLISSSLPSHFEMMTKVRTKLDSWSPTLFIGWNSIRFDEGLVRQSLYQTLHRPYLTNTNGNCRSDAMRIVQASSVFAPDKIKVPINQKGRQSFRLGEIATLNGFAQHQAHETIGDIEATIHMCRLVKENVPDLWSNMIRFSQKAAVLSFAAEETVFSFTDFYSSRPYSRLVTFLGPSSDTNSACYIYDLQHAPQELDRLDEHALKNRLKSSPKPVLALKANAAPIIAYEDGAPATLADRLPSNQEASERAEFLARRPALRERLLETAHELRTQYSPSLHVEKQIYDSFGDDGDWNLASDFHATTWDQRVQLVRSFSDERFQILGQRLIYEASPESLNTAERANMDKRIEERLLGGAATDTPWRTLPQAIAEVEQIISKSEKSELEQLNSIKSYLNSKLSEIVN